MVAVGAVNQLFAMLAQGWNPALAAGFLGAAGFEGVGLQFFFQLFGGDIKRFGKTEYAGVAKPHQGWSLSFIFA